MNFKQKQKARGQGLKPNANFTGCSGIRPLLDTNGITQKQSLFLDDIYLTYGTSLNKQTLNIFFTKLIQSHVQNNEVLLFSEMGTHAEGMYILVWG